VIAIANQEQSLKLVDMLRREHPHLRILARAVSRQHAYELLRHGVNDVYRETLGSALDLGVDALRALGLSAEQAERGAELFREHDEAAVRDMATMDPADARYISRARQHTENLERALLADRERRERASRGD
jgi:voltage-gated potassium channel Kch